MATNHLVASIVPMRILVVTGMSGSGKTTAIRALEDEGFYCIDNLPVRLFRTFAGLLSRSGDSFKGIALVADIRGREFFKGYENSFRHLRKAGHNVEILFFDASDEVLIRRFSETRRRHPAGETLSINDNIREEREHLCGLRQMSTLVVDTSEFNVHQLREFVTRYVRGESGSSYFTVDIQSFGFRYGVPLESNIVMDVRFLPNPHFVAELKPLTGLDKRVSDYVLESAKTGNFLDRFFPLIDFLVPEYRQEGKSFLTVSIGCTGGKHRSVAVAEALGDHVKSMVSSVRITHRDKDKG